MHPNYEQANTLTSVVIGAAIEIHRALGPGLLESIYERCFAHELRLRGIPAERQRLVRVRYKDLAFEEHLRCDILVGQCLLVELKAVNQVHPLHLAQLLTYMKLLDIPLGILINFNEVKVSDGIRRMILPGANILPMTPGPTSRSWDIAPPDSTPT